MDSRIRPAIAGVLLLLGSWPARAQTGSGPAPAIGGGAASVASPAAASRPGLGAMAGATLTADRNAGSHPITADFAVNVDAES